MEPNNYLQDVEILDEAPPPRSTTNLFFFGGWEGCMYAYQCMYKNLNRLGY